MSKQMLVANWLWMLLVVGLMACSPMQGGKKLSAADFKQTYAKQKGLIVDVRTPDEWAEGHLKEAVLADWTSGQLEQAATKWAKDKPVYVYCASGMRSSAAAGWLTAQGFKQVYNVGTFDDLAAAGWATAK